MKIKFRVWDTQDKRWAHSEPSVRYPADDEADNRVQYIDYRGFIYSAPYGDLDQVGSMNDKHPRYIVSLWTGLTDGRGHDVYEGDLLVSPNDATLRTVVWEHLWERPLIPWPLADVIDFPLITDVLAGGATVVGNIYEQEGAANDAAE